jgi:L-cystine uptake protein TcyP (sodium:dicarboxylate symporter family)
VGPTFGQDFDGRRQYLIFLLVAGCVLGGVMGSFTFYEITKNVGVAIIIGIGLGSLLNYIYYRKTVDKVETSNSMVGWYILGIVIPSLGFIALIAAIILGLIFAAIYIWAQGG